MSVSGDFGPAPPGMDLNESQASSMYGSIITTALAGTFAVIARFYARLLLRNPIGADDWLIVAALVFTWGTAIATFAAIPDGMDKHMFVLTRPQFNRLWQNLFAYVNIYVIAVSFTKLSIVMFYKRVFQIPKIAWGLVAIVLMYPITVIITICNSCKPLDFFWTQYTNPRATGSCIDISTFFFANGIWAACIDVGLLIVPIPLVWKLQMHLRKRLAVVGIFLLAGFVAVASIVRIIMLQRNTQSHDPVWTIAPVYIWSSVEPFVGIICACLPTLSPLFKRFWTARRTQSSSRMTPNSEDLYDTISGSRNKHLRKLPRGLSADDEVMLTSVCQKQADTTARHLGSEDDISTAEQIHVRKDFDVDWSSKQASIRSEP
ncbi:hypothetical protein KC356_g2985 [Hortaea werneckii]|nr:hypothetical protein KC356_g2985 [Hortaea werneckii]